MKKTLLLAVAVFLLTLALYAPREASAVPAFARQTGMACNTCHFQHYPSLNAFGRTFKAGGYTMIGGQSMIEGDMLSIPSVLNASLITKLRYQKRNGDDETAINKGEFQIPDEAALLIGGRAGEHFGFLLEAALQGGDLFTSFKSPVVFDVQDTKLSVIPFTTDALGASYGLELLNTGAVRNQRPIEHRTEMSAQQFIGTATGATGLTFAAVRDIGFVNYTAWYDQHNAGGDPVAVGPFLHYVRAAVTPTFQGWDFGAGFQWWGGDEKIESGDPLVAVRKTAEAWAFDAQAQGTVADFPLGVYFSYANANKSDATDTNIFNSETADDKTAWAIMAEVGVIPNRLTVAAGYRDGNTGAATNDEDNATTLAAVYTPLQNLQLQLDYTWYSGDAPTSAAGPGDQLATLMLFAAF